jgi:hypothetical protein
MTPTTERVYLVQILAAVEVVAVSPQEAKQIALETLARRCERGSDMLVRAEEVKR